MNDYLGPNLATGNQAIENQYKIFQNFAYFDNKYDKINQEDSPVQKKMQKRSRSSVRRILNQSTGVSRNEYIVANTSH